VIRYLRLLQIRAAHRKPLVNKNFGNAAHPNATDADKMNALKF
jgi:hypothetical protein